MSLRKLASETAIYGISSIFGRVINFALVPLYTGVFAPEVYANVTLLFTIMGFMMVLFTYRMELAYFRFGADESLDRATTFQTAFSSILFSTIILAVLVLLVIPHFVELYALGSYRIYVYLCLGIVGLDALSELPYAHLRLESRPIRFATIRLVNIFVNLGINLFFLWLCPKLLTLTEWNEFHPFIHKIYRPDIGIGYIFIANFVASLVTFLLLSPSLQQFRFLFNAELWKKMIRYALPLVVVGIAFLINEMLDKLLIPQLYPGTQEEANAALGVYGANYKLAMLIALFTQAFRYGAEPFFFKNRNKENASELYAMTAKYFLIVGCIGFLFVTLYLDWFKLLFLRNERYWEGIIIVPIILLANILAGVYYNFSVWYKLIDQTRWGAYLSVGGAVITIVLNVWWIPHIGYMGAAWATLICYASMTTACYWLGQKHHAIPYPIAKMLLYLAIAVAVFLLSQQATTLLSSALWAKTLVNTGFLLGYLIFIFAMERQEIRGFLNLSNKQKHRH